jgi:hypothetical protein
VYRDLAKPYDLDSLGNIMPGQYSMFFNPAAGLISSARDLAKFDIALDEERLISTASKELAFTRAVSPSGEQFPYGIGWFVQEYDGVKLVWHGGEWNCTSALYLKVPEEELTFIVLANARSMSGAFSMGEGDVLNSGVGLAFLRVFVFEDRYREISPDIDWKTASDGIVGEISNIRSEDMRKLYRRQLRNMETMYLRVGPIEVFRKLVEVIHPLLIDYRNQLSGQVRILGEISGVGNNEHRVLDFRISRTESVHIHCIGEVWEGKVYDYGWIEQSATGDTVWCMDANRSIHAGGSVKNRVMDGVVQLQPGLYRLHFSSDDSHSYEHWNAAPPDEVFWGIVVYTEEGR